MVTVRDLLFFAVFSLGPMIAAVGITLGIVVPVQGFLRFPWYIAVVFSPLLYTIWLLVYLSLCRWTSGRLGRKHPKPRYLVYGGPQTADYDMLSVLNVGMCYNRLSIVETLPLAWTLARIGSLTALVLGSYSPSVHIGRRSIVWGQIFDPDLTEIGDDVVIGALAVITAHGESLRPDGSHVYVSGPITIGNRVTIGGGARVSLGCVIGDDAILEPGAVLPPYTVVPAGEVWSGNPPVCRRGRQERSENSSSGQATAIPEEIAALVRDALKLRTDLPAEQWSRDSIAAWDSLGQIAIAAALFDRYGITVSGNELFRIQCLADVANTIAKRQTSPTQPGVQSLELPDDVELLPLLDTSEVTRALTARAQTPPAAARHLRVLIAATFVAEPIAPALRTWGLAFGFDLEVQFAPYNQIVQTLLEPPPAFRQNHEVVNVILARPEDFNSDVAQAEFVLQAIEANASLPSRGNQLLAANLPSMVSPFAGYDRKQVESLRDYWRTRLASMRGVEVFDFAEVVEHVGIERALNGESEILTRAPYSPVLYQELAVALVRRIRAGRKSASKVIVLDCDNTLWGGVVGEAGINGVELGPDGAGRAFQLFQRQLRHLRTQGLLLAVASRNEEPDVREMFNQHPEMVLRADDIVAWRVNWRKKSENLREIAEELNVGLDSLVFLDDDPSVRLEVKTALPQVHVVPLPPDPSQYCKTLGRLWLFDGITATEVDSRRTEMMHVESLRQQERTASANVEEYLAALEIRVEIRAPLAEEWSRVAQLTQRTNQFNLSLQRRSTEEAVALQASSTVLIIRAEDRFGDYGLVGIAIVKDGGAPGVHELETFLMSCRALGRGVEDAFLFAIAEECRRRQGHTLIAPYVEGPRNAQVRDFLSRSGFQETQPDLWQLPLGRAPERPAHVRYIDTGRAAETGRAISS